MTLLHVVSYGVRVLLKLKLAAKELSISERFLRQLIADNSIPFYRLSKRTLRVDLNELRDYMRFVAGGKPSLNNGGTGDE